MNWRGGVKSGFKKFKCICSDTMGFTHMQIKVVCIYINQAFNKMLLNFPYFALVAVCLVLHLQNELINMKILYF